MKSNFSKAEQFGKVADGLREKEISSRFFNVMTGNFLLLLNSDLLINRIKTNCIFHNEISKKIGLMARVG